MTEKFLKAYNEKLKELSREEEIERNNYLFDLMTGKIQGPITGYPTIDKPWAPYYKKNQLNDEIPKNTAYRYVYNNNSNFSYMIAIEYFGNEISYEKLFNKIDETAKALIANGVRKGDTVTISSITTPEVIYLFYALNKIGAIANFVDPRTNEDRLIEIINTTNSKLFFYLDLIDSKIDLIRSKLDVHKCIYLSAFDSIKFPLNSILKIKNSKRISHDKAISFGEFKKSGRIIINYNEMKYVPDYPAAIVYTGGTTGVPKGAVLTNDNLNALAFMYHSADIGINRGLRLLDIMPPFIAYGLNVGIHTPLAIGVTDVVIPKFEADKFQDYIIKYRPNIVVGVPSFFDLLTSSKKLEKYDLSFLIYPCVGGDSMNLSLEEKLNEFFASHSCSAKITKGYGMTELSGAAIISSLEANKLGSVGVPFANNTVGIFKEGTEEELPVGEIGEICVTGPTIFKGYLNNETEDKKVKKVHSDGKVWIHSGDYGYIDQDGFLFVKGRIKRTIVRPDGHNNYPLEIETVINAYNGVQNSAVIDIPADKYGNGHIPVAFVVMNGEFDQLLTKAKIQEYCSKRLPNRDVACNIIFIDEIPKTNIGKVDYKKLLEMLKEMIEKDGALEDEIYNNYENTLVLK